MPSWVLPKLCKNATQSIPLKTTCFFPLFFYQNQAFHSPTSHPTLFIGQAHVNQTTFFARGSINYPKRSIWWILGENKMKNISKRFHRTSTLISMISMFNPLPLYLPWDISEEAQRLQLFKNALSLSKMCKKREKIQIFFVLVISEQSIRKPPGATVCGSKNTTGIELSKDQPTRTRRKGR